MLIAIIAFQISIRFWLLKNKIREISIIIKTLFAIGRHLRYNLAYEVIKIMLIFNFNTDNLYINRKELS